MGSGSSSRQKSEDSSSSQLKGLVISIGISLSLLGYLLYLGSGWWFLFNRIVVPLVRLFAIISVTLTLSAILEGMGWSKAIARYARPIMRLGGFSDYVGLAFTTAFLSGVAANTMLLNAYEENRITQRELLLANLLNTGLPSYFLHLPTTIAIIVPLVGTAGAIYLVITFSAALIRTVFITLMGRLFLERGEPHGAQLMERRDRSRYKKKIYGWPMAKRLVRRYLVARMGRIAFYTVPIYLGVVLAQQVGVFEWLQGMSSHLLTVPGLPIESISVVAFTILAEFTAGAAAAGAMVHSGILTVKETVLALVLGNIIATPFRAIRHQLPRYLGIYRPKLGITLLAAGQGLRIVSVVLVTAIYVLIG